MSQPMQNGHPEPAPAAKKQRNIIGIAALVTAIIGFIFAVMEGAYIIGWILLPIAFVLSLVGLAQRGKPKVAAIAALIISIVGTIAGVLAFMSSTVTAIDEAFNEQSSQIPEPAGDESEAPLAEEEQRVAESAGSVEAADSDLGTRQNPYPLGSTIANSEWEITVNSVDLDATEKVLAANPFNDKPEEGQTYGLANVTTTYVGDDSSTIFDLGFAYVNSSGNAIEDVYEVAPDQLSDETLYTGASATGNVLIAHDDGGAGVLRVRPGFLADEVFFAVS